MNMMHQETPAQLKKRNIRELIGVGRDTVGRWNRAEITVEEYNAIITENNAKIERAKAHKFGYHWA